MRSVSARLWPVFPQKFLTLRLLVVLSLLISLFVTSCKKESPGSDEEKEEQLTADASYNNAILAGAGNLFYEEKLTPNSLSQLVATLAYGQDNIGFYGKINAAGQLEYIHTVIREKNNGTELLVTENFPEISASRMYTITNKQKSRFVIETRHLNKTDMVVNVLDYDWTTNKFKTIKSTYFSDGQPKATSREGNLSGKLNVWNCDQPQPTDDISQDVQNHGEYFACGGLAWDTHPTLNGIKQSILTTLDGLKSLDDYKDKLPELNNLKNGFDFSINYKDIISKLPKLKFSTKRLESLLKLLEELYKKLMEENEVVVTLVPFDAATDLDYDETTDSEIKLTFTLIEKKTGLAYTDRPVYIDFAIVKPGTNEAVHMETVVSKQMNGLVVFRIDPLKIEDYKQYTKLQVRYAFTQEKWSSSSSKDVTLRFIDQVFTRSGNMIPSTIEFDNAISQDFKLVDKSGSSFPNLNNSLVTISNNTNNKVAVNQKSLGDAFGLTLSSTEYGVFETSFDLLYAGRKIQTMKAKLNNPDSLPIYRAAATGNWTMQWQDPGPQDNDEINKFRFYADGTGVYYWMKSSGAATGQDIDPSNPVYKINWQVRRVSQGVWYLDITYPNRGWFSTARLFLEPTRCGEPRTDGLFFLGTKD